MMNTKNDSAFSRVVQPTDAGYKLIRKMHLKGIDQAKYHQSLFLISSLSSLNEKEYDFVIRNLY